MSPLTVHLLIRNHETVIEAALDSLVPLNAHIIVGDIGSQDQTKDICYRYGAEVVRTDFKHDLSAARNSLLTDKWHMYIEPWEVLLSGHDRILEITRTRPAAYHLGVIQGDVITKQIRLWHKDLGLRFTNPVFETILASGVDSGAYIVGGGDDIDFQKGLLTKWQEKQPLALEPYYYRACLLLTEKKYKEFLNVANHFIFQSKEETMAVIMTRYYCAMVCCYLEKSYKRALEYLLPCIVARPLMAEYWCLLADVYYSGRDYEKAFTFYENAMTLGSRRLRDDDWPFEVSRYREYPLKMMEACRKVTASSRLYKGAGSPPSAESPASTSGLSPVLPSASECDLPPQP